MVAYNPYDRETTHNPYPVYKELRDSAPVYHNKEMGFWALSRHADVSAAHADATTFSGAGGVTLDGSTVGTPLLIVMDDPEHRWHRKLVNGAFTPRRIAALEPFIRDKANALLDAVADQDDFDLVEDFSIRLPLDIISELLGIPEELRRDVNVLSNQLIIREDPDNPDAAAGLRGEAGLKLIELYMELVRERRAAPKDDVISLLIESDVHDEDAGTYRRLRDDEVAFRFMEMGVAGHETVAKLIPNALIGLSWFPDQRRQLVEDRSLLKNAYENPEDLDIHRQIRRQVGFGYGIHACLGAALARLETRVALDVILARYPDYRCDHARAVRYVQANVRGLSHIPLVPNAA